MKSLLASLLYDSPAPIHPTARFVDHGTCLPDESGNQWRTETGLHHCVQCWQWLPRADMHTCRDGRAGTTCKTCTATLIAKRHKREETTAPARVARRLAKACNCIIREDGGVYAVYRKSGTPPAMIGRSHSPQGLLKFMRRVARNA